MRKTCLHCEREKPRRSFYRSNKHADGRLKVCIPCRKAQVKAREEGDPALRELRALQSRDRHLRRKYGITLDEFNAMYDEQGGRCAACERQCMRGGQTTLSLCVDHDHKTGAFRGLLCQSCNTILGRVEDDPAVLHRLADYLDRAAVSR